MHRSDKLFNRGLLSVIGAQFFSALADNVLFFTILTYFNKHKEIFPDYSIYVLQSMFIAAYIILAPIVGFIADKRPKGSVLMLGNGLKLFGVLLLFFNINPYICYGIVGVGAAIYSPAKFGILSELVTNRLLIKANGVVEGSTIIAILTGSVLGGVLAEKNFSLALTAIVVTYISALLFNILIPKIYPEQDSATKLSVIIKSFLISLQQLFWDGRARFAILGTSLFWGAASTLRLLLNDWVSLVLGKGTDTVAIFNAIVGIGIIFGALFASLFITARNISRCLWFGFLMGLVAIIFSFQTNLYAIYILLLLIGALGGAFIIPLNSLLQERGQQFEGTGKAVAVQKFSENIIMICMMGLFGFFTLLEVSAIKLMIGFGFFFATCIIGLTIHMYKRHILA